MHEALWSLLETLHVDAKKRQLIWPDGQRLNFDGSVQNILADYPQFPSQLIEFRLISWMEMDYVPENYSPKQLDQFDRLTERWVDELDKRFPQSGAP